MAELLSVNVGLPKDISWHGKTVHTGIWKHAITGRRMVRRLNIDGDKQGDLIGHGGEQRAVLVYQIESYHYWAKEFARSDFVYGQFGENFTITGLPDDEVCIGDRYRIGTALFEVTQPRITCYRVGIRMGVPQMPALLVSHHRPGFYFRVLQEGEVGAGDTIVKIAQGPEKLSVTTADALVFLKSGDQEALARALRIAAFSPGWKTALRAMAERAKGVGWHEDRGVILNYGTRPAWSGFRPLEVAEVREESRSVLGFDLTLPPNGVEPPTLPGQFITLKLPSEDPGTPLYRSYSVTDTSRPGHYPIGVKCAAHGAAGRYLREHVRAGARIEVAAPRGGFVLREGQGQHPAVFLSAGIGVTPVLAMLRQLAAHRSTRAISWIYGAHDGAEHPFARDVAALLSSLPQSRRLIAYSRPRPEDREGADFDRPGRLSPEALERFGVPADADVYLCGPESFMQAMTEALVALHIAPDHIRTENFGTRAPLRPGLTDRHHRGVPHVPEGPAGSGPRVSFARSGISVHWDDRYASLLELAEACDLDVRWACRTGLCHTCITRLLSGDVRYNPEPVEYPNKGSALICCSRPSGEVVLDA